MTRPHSDDDAWSARWQQLARAAGIAPEARLCVALSGGADSVLLVQLLAAARPRPEWICVHVDHGLRGQESDADAEFCRTLANSLGAPLVVRRAHLDPATPGLEARAREARYRLLLEEARARGFTTLLTGHHADDQVETLLMRWMRGTELGGLSGAQSSMLVRGEFPGQSPLAREAEMDPVRVVRPLRPLRRAEVRELLRGRGFEWREDSTNADPRFTRSRVRGSVLPALEEHCGADVRERLDEFAEAVERLESSMARATAHLAWQAPESTLASRTSSARALGGRVPRSELMRLADSLCRRALWRLLTEGSGHAPGRNLLATIVSDLKRGRCSRHTLPGSWTLQLRAASIELLPPANALFARRVSTAGVQQLALPFLERRELVERFSSKLPVPGTATLPDGRAVSAEWVSEASDLPRGPDVVELDAAAFERSDSPYLELRYGRPGDRFHPLGAPGSRALVRFLADAGVAREERAAVPLVTNGDEICWAVGLRPAEAWRVSSSTAKRLRLRLHAQAPRARAAS